MSGPCTASGGAPLRLLSSSIDDDPARWAALGASVRASLGGTASPALEAVLAADVESEYDARFLAAHLRRRLPSMGPAFRRALETWERDEELHYTGFAVIYRAAFGQSAAAHGERMAARAADVDFEPLGHLIEDEFAVLCLLAYDELATVRAYRGHRSDYRPLGPSAERFVAEVTADEGRHAANFMRLLRSQHPHRLGEVPRAVERIRATEGTAYANTFVLDHDGDDVWSDAIFDEAAELLVRRLA